MTKLLENLKTRLVFFIFIFFNYLFIYLFIYLFFLGGGGEGHNRMNIEQNQLLKFP